MRIDNPYNNNLRNLSLIRVDRLVLRLFGKSRMGYALLGFTSLQILEIPKFVVSINRDINPSRN